MRIFNHLLRIVTVILLCVGHFQSYAHPSVQYLNMNDRNPATLAEPPAMPKGSYQMLRSILDDTSTPSRAPVEQPTSQPSLAVKKKRRRTDVFKYNWGIIIGISLGSMMVIYAGRKIYKYFFGEKL